MKNYNYMWIIGSRLYEVQAAFWHIESSLHFIFVMPTHKNQPKQ